MGLIRVVFALGVLAAILALVLSPWPWTAPFPASVGLIWAAYDLIEVTDDDADVTPAPRR